MNMQQTALSNAQVEILSLFNQDLSEVEILELKRLLVLFKSKRAFELIDDLWEKNGWTEETMQTWAAEHNRIPYTAQKTYLSKQKND